jgi:hypothetical protein
MGIIPVAVICLFLGLFNRLLRSGNGDDESVVGEDSGPSTPTSLHPCTATKFLTCGKHGQTTMAKWALLCGGINAEAKRYLTME